MSVFDTSNLWLWSPQTLRSLAADGFVRSDHAERVLPPEPAPVEPEKPKREWAPRPKKCPEAYEAIMKRLADGERPASIALDFPIYSNKQICNMRAELGLPPLPRGGARVKKEKVDA